MARFSQRAQIGLALLIASVILSLLHILVFEEPRTLFFYLALDIVFVPIQVLLVTIIIDRLLSEREKRTMMKKLNMVIGAFFSEVGYDLIQRMGKTCRDFDELAERLAVDGRWDKEKYRSALAFAESYQCRFDSQPVNLTDLRGFLVSRRQFILALLQNPNLLEHESFTDLLWAVCHLTEELSARPDVESLPRSDLKHIEGDILRAFNLLAREWLAYMQHLKENYPYMYSLAVRMNPFNPQASPLVLS